MNRILLIEDEEIILKALRRLLERNHFEVTTATTVEEAIEAEPQSFDLVLADLRLPGAEGTDIIPLADPIPVVIMTSHASVRSAVNAMRSGAIDYIAKPFDHDELLLIIERSLMQNRLRAQNQSLKQDLARLVPSQNVAQCAGTQPLLENLSDLNEQHRFINLHGQHGTGKELFARKLHANSERADAPFVVIDLPAIDADQIQELLLGGENRNDKIALLQSGQIHAAHNGTLTLRHPVAIPLPVQEALASALTLRGLPASGGVRNINVRTIVISDASLSVQASYGLIHPGFAELFEEHQFPVPALSSMPNDIPALAQHYLGYFEHYHFKKERHFSDDAIAALRAYSWPGNTDELKSVIERAVLISSEKQIQPHDLGIVSEQGDQQDTGRDLSLDEYFRYVVMRHQGTLSETELASRLGISRKALWERRQKMGLLRS